MKELVYVPKRKPGGCEPISKDCRTPFLRVKFCSLLKPFYYATSPTVPRYSISCVLDRNEKVENDFIQMIETIEGNEKIPDILKPEMVKAGDQNVLTNNILIKFQTKTVPPVYLLKKDKTAQLLSLQGEIEPGERVMVVFDILRYSLEKKDKSGKEKGISFKPSRIYLAETPDLQIEEA